MCVSDRALTVVFTGYRLSAIALTVSKQAVFRYLLLTYGLVQADLRDLNLFDHKVTIHKQTKKQIFHPATPSRTDIKEV